MQARRIRGGAIGLVLAVLVATPAVAGAKFDGFLAGLDRACARSSDFEALQTSLAAKFLPGGDPLTRLVLPESLGSAIGAVTTDDVGDHVRVNVALDGTFRGLKLEKLVFYFGKDNGINGWAVEFAEPADRLGRVLAKAVAKGNRRLAETMPASAASTGLDFEGRAAVFCDFST